MLIEKRKLSGGMNSDLSERELPDTDCLNIMNMRMAVAKQGRYGRLENITGTTQITDNIRPPYGTSQAIGTAIDWEEMRILALNYNTVNDHWISCYDPSANNGAGKLYAVLYDSQVIGGLNFSKNSLIHSARVQNGTLYWADSTNNEPRSIIINAGISMNHAGVYPDVSPYQYPMNQSVIRWIKRQPGLVLSSQKIYDSTYLNNFIKNEAFQFSWRYIYRGYETSTLSGLSTLQNYNLASDTYNYIEITAPAGETIQQDVLQVDFVVKYLNGGKSFIIHSWNRDVAADLAAINAHNAGTTALSFNFYNNFLGIALDDAYSVKPFDSVPIYVQTIEMARFRSFMANYTTGYNTPLSTSLSATFITKSQGDTINGVWQIVSPVAGAGATYYILYLTNAGSNTGYYVYAPNENTGAPYPATVAWGSLTFIGASDVDVADHYGNPLLFVSADVPYATSSLTGAPFVVDIANTTVFKSGASYKISVNFFDHSGRKCGVSAPNVIYTTPDRLYNTVSFTTSLNWLLSNTNALTEIPSWAYYYSINITKCLTTRYFLDARVKNITYATKDTSGEYVFNTAAYSPTLNGVAFDFTRLNGWGAGYVFTEGDLVKIYYGTSVYNLSIVGQEGNWVICELKNLGTLGTTATPVTNALFEIYTPYKPSLSEPYFEVGQIFTIDNPTTNSRAYSILAGSITGDVVLLTRNDGTADYLTQNMSPNDKYYQQWNTDAGRPNFIDTIGQVVKDSSIAYSNTFISGSKVNGLSTYDALDTKDIQCGNITKLQVANKTGEDQGDIMLAICDNEVASLYLGEVQLVGQASNAFVAQAPNVIGTVNVLKGSLGTTKAESVSCYLGLVFGIDLNKGIFWQYSPAGLEPVSRYKTTRFFKNYCDAYLASNNNNLDNINGFHHLRGSINPFHKEASITLPSLIYENYADTLPSYTSVPTYASSIIDRFDLYDQLGKTMNFCFDENKWGSGFQWLPEWSEWMQNSAYYFKNGYMYIADSNTSAYNTVFGTKYPMRICTTANLNSSMLKDLFNIAIEGDGTIPDFVVALTAIPNQQITDLAGTDQSWEVNESVVDAAFLMDRLSPNVSGSDDNKLFTGDVLKDFAIFVMVEYNSVYNRLLYVDYINIGYDQSKGQSNITNVINK